MLRRSIANLCARTRSQPAPGAFIFGGGHIALKIARQSRPDLAGFQRLPAVIDDRDGAYANRDRFPDAQSVYADEYEAVFPQLNIIDTSYIIIVTRGHRDDMRVLKWAVTTQARYIAMIGSKRKVISVVKELEKEGIPRNAFEPPSSSPMVASKSAPYRREEIGSGLARWSLK